MFRSRAPLYFMLAAAMLLALPASGQWTNQSNVNTAVSTINNYIDFTQIVKGANNGTFVLWSRTWSGGLRRLGRRDRRLGRPALHADGAGGAVVAWQTASKTSGSVGDIYAQYVEAGTGAAWSAGGLVVSNASDAQHYPDVVSDAECPAKISWSDYRTDGDPREVDQDAAHLPGGHDIEMRPAVPAHVRVDQAQIRFVHQLGGL